jgi:hypothetical protein
MATLGAAVPEAAIYKNSNSFSRKEEIWNTQNALLVHFPAANFAPSENCLHSQLCSSIAGRTNRAHIFASARADLLFHSRLFQLV